MERDSTRGAIQPGLKILGFSARPNRLENLKKSHVIETEFQPGLDMRSDFVSRKQDGCRYKGEAISVE